MEIKTKIRVKEVLFIIMLAIILCLPYFIGGLSKSWDDGLFHIAKLKGIVDAWDGGQMIPRVYPSYNNNFGYGEPLFYCDLFLYPFAFLYKLGLPILVSFKLLLVFYSSLSIINIFYVSKRISKNKYTPYIITILYTFSSYHLIDLHKRMALGEIFAITFIPILIYSLYLIFIKKDNSWVLLGLGFTFLLFSHNLTFALYCLLLVLILAIYSIINFKDKKELKRIWLVTFKGTILAIILCAWYLLPMIEQIITTKYTFVSYSENYDLSVYVASLKEMFSFNSILLEGNIENIGIGWPLIIATLLYLFEDKNKTINILLCIGVILWLCIFGIIPIHLISMFNSLQFAFRFYMLLFPLHTFICIYTIDNFKHKSIILIISVLFSLIGITSITYNCYINSETYKDNELVSDILDDSLYQSYGYNFAELMNKEYLPYVYGSDNDFISDKRIINELYDDGWSYNATIFPYQYKEDNEMMIFTYNFKEEITLMIPKTYYKGYQAYLYSEDGWIKLNTYMSDIYGLVCFDAPIGENTIIIKYSGTTIQKISVIVSCLGAIALVGYIFINNKNNKLAN